MAKKTGQIVSFAEFRLRRRNAPPLSTHDRTPATAEERRSPEREAAASLPPTALPASEAPDAERLLQSGVLAYRRAKNGELLVLLVRKRRSKQWGIPKGKVEAHLSFGENAAKEAFEEAGVRGNLSPNSVGVFRATKRSPSRLAIHVIEVWVYLLEVTECLSRWPERGKRETTWVPCEDAAALLREPVLADLCRRLARARDVQ
jgi:8-oxo-dGTP pyrophosphatase MutT (NUDIX family)